MARRRDNLIAGIAFVLMAAFAALIVATVFDAQSRGRRALERQKLEQIEQLAASMDTRLESVEEAFAGITAFDYELTPGSAADQEIIDGFQAQNATARTGYLLVDADGRLTAGTLLLDRESVGEQVAMPGLEEALEEGGGGVLPVTAGLTTDLPVLPVYGVIADANGSPRGAIIFESEVSADSQFNQEVSTLGSEATGDFFFVDPMGTVVAASNPDLIGRRFDDEALLAREAGFARDGGEVSVVADVPSADWRATFRQDSDDFEGGLGQRLQLAILLIVLVGVLAAGLSVIVLIGRLRAAARSSGGWRRSTRRARSSSASCPTSCAPPLRA